MFFTFFELYKWYQIAQTTTYVIFEVLMILFPVFKSYENKCFILPIIEMINMRKKYGFFYSNVTFNWSWSEEHATFISVILPLFRTLHNGWPKVNLSAMSIAVIRFIFKISFKIHWLEVKLFIASVMEDALGKMQISGFSIFPKICTKLRTNIAVISPLLGRGLRFSKR